MSTIRLDHLVHRAHRLARAGDRPRWLAALAAQAFVLGTYLLAVEDAVTAPRYLLYPFVWINVGMWAVIHADPNPGSRRHRLGAGSVATVYLLAMLAVAGFLGTGTEAMTGWRFVSAPPGWGPMIAYQGPFVRLYLVPFQVIGYVSLAYLLYGAVLRASRGALPGALGLISCVGCTWSIVAPLVAGGLGGVSTIGATMYSLSYDLTTVVFLVTVALLYWSQRGENP